jgi:hypothetical protein
MSDAVPGHNLSISDLGIFAVFYAGVERGKGPHFNLVALGPFQGFALEPCRVHWAQEEPIIHNTPTAALPHAAADAVLLRRTHHE